MDTIVKPALWLALIALSIACVPSTTNASLGPTPPLPLRAPGAMAALPPTPSPSALAAARRAATDMLTQRFGISADQATHNLDVQAKAGDLGGKLHEQLGTDAFSHMELDNEAGRYVVTRGKVAGGDP